MATGNMKHIKRRMKSVQSTMQITKAMELVASSKMRHARERVMRAKPYFNTLKSTMERIARTNRDMNSVFTKPREIKKSLFIVIAGDRGLAGGYNSTVLKLATQKMHDKTAAIVTIGKKAEEYYAKRDYPVYANYSNIAETMRISDTHEIVELFLDKYRTGEVDEVFLCYTEYVTPLTQHAHCTRVLPLAFDDAAGKSDKAAVLTEYDPSPEAVFEHIVPEYLNGVLYGAVVESYASEQSARRMAMENATDNASEMIENLNLSYNRARQAAITQEITEIVSGAGQVGSQGKQVQEFCQ